MYGQPVEKGPCWTLTVKLQVQKRIFTYFWDQKFDFACVQNKVICMYV